MTKQINADNLLLLVREDFNIVPDSQADNAQISLDDELMSALAMFMLKDSSQLAFENWRRERLDNLHTIFGIKSIPWRFPDAYST